MNKLYLVETGFIAAFSTNIYLTDNIENAKKQVANLIKKFKEFYPDIQFIGNDLSCSTDILLVPKSQFRYWANPYIQTREIEISFEYNTNDTVFLAEHRIMSGFPLRLGDFEIEQKYPKIEEYIENISPKPISEGVGEREVFATKSDAEEYIAQANKEYRDNNDDDWFARVIPFKNEFPLHNIDNP